MNLRLLGATLCLALARFALCGPTTGLTPLTDFGPEQTYKGLAGGLYGNNFNDRPPRWDQALLMESAEIVPRSPDGTPDAGGKIGFVTVGMSNTSQESNAFIRLATQSGIVAPNVVLVNGAQGGQDAKDWGSGNVEEVWTTLRERVRQAGLSRNQVQAIRLKQALARPAQYGEWTDHLEVFTGEMEVLLHRLKRTFPNLKVVYLSSRIYGGYATTELNPEPYAYEYAFAIRRLIQLQSAGVPGLNWDEAKGAVRSAILCWGPYLWADGENARSDGLTWLREDFARDGTHPSASGARKVARMLIDFFSQDASSRWFLKPQD